MRRGLVKMKPVRGLYILSSPAMDLIYGPAEREAIETVVSIVAAPQTPDSIAENPSLLRDVDVLFSGWGAPILDAAFLEQSPRLKAVFYGAGAISSFTTEAFWNRGIVITSAASANARPVAEYSLATILFSLKHGWALSRQTHATRTFPPRDGAPGTYGSTVGLVSLGAIARSLIGLLSHFDLRLIAYDPFLSQTQARELGVELVSLDEVFSRSDVVSVHTPSLPETRGLITGRHLDSMKPGATLINTARGEVIREDEMIAVLQRRADLFAVLDVLVDEPPEKSSPLWEMPNVLLTPHIAGSVGTECRRMGRYMVEELHRYLAGEPLKWQVTREMARNSIHRPLAVSVRSSMSKKNPAPAGSGL